MKKIILFLGLVLFYNDTKAQAIDVYYNRIYSNRHLYRANSSNFTDYGFFTYNFGANYHLRTKKRLGYILGVGYDKKGYDREFRVTKKYQTFRYDILTIQALANLKLPRNEFQMGIYYGKLIDATVTPDDNISKEIVRDLKNYSFGVKTVIHQELFDTKYFQGFFRLEGNYDLTSFRFGYDAFSFKYFERAVTVGAGLVLRWNYKQKE